MGKVTRLVYRIAIARLMVPLVERVDGRTCFCLMGGAAALLVAERGQTYYLFPDGDFSNPLMNAYHDLAEAIGAHWRYELECTHDSTADVKQMHAKVSALVAEARKS